MNRVGKVKANSLEKFMPLIICQEQRTFILGRQIIPSKIIFFFWWKAIHEILPMLIRFKGHNFLELWCGVILNGSGDNLVCFAMLSWSIWLVRNQLVFEGRIVQTTDAVNRASELFLKLCLD